MTARSWRSSQSDDEWVRAFRDAGRHRALLKRVVMALVFAAACVVGLLA